MKLLITIFLSLISFMAGAQNMAINNTGASAHPKAILDLQSTDKGFLVPRMTEAQRTAMFSVADATARGTLVYQTDNVDGYYYYDGANWKYIFTSAAGWSLTGNSGTNATNNFVGTTDNNDLVFRSNNTEGMRLKTNGNVGIGINSPGNKLYVRNGISTIASAHPFATIATESNNPNYFNLLSSSETGILFGANTNNTDGGVIYNNPLVPKGMMLRTNGNSTKMIIDSNGNVSVGPIYYTTVRHAVTGTDSLPYTATIRNLAPKANPSLWFLSENNTSMGYIGSGNSAANSYANQFFAGSIAAIPFVLSTASTERMRITETGRIGIGTTAPAAKTEINYNSGTGNQQLRLTEAQNDFARLGFYNNAATRFWETAAYPSDDSTNAFFNIYNSATGNVFTVRGDTSVGIGVSNPVYPLQFANVLGQKIVLWNVGNGNSYGLGIQGSLMQVHTGSVFDDITFGYGNSNALTENVRFKGNGNVGIGTSNPGNKLFVKSGASGIASAHPSAVIATESNIANYINLLSPLESGVLFGAGTNNSDGGMVYNNVNNLNGLQFRTNGNNTRMVIDQNGRVGIGTIAPAAYLQVYGNSAVSYPHISLSETDAADFSRLTFDNPASTKFWTIAAHADNTDANALLNIYNSSTGDLLSVRGNGYVGIGTSAPNTKLNVMGSETNMPVRIQNQLNSGYAGIHFANAGGTTQGHIGYGNPGAGSFANQVYMGSATAIPVVITTADVERVRVDATGNVGIGTNNPTTDLEVNGFTKLGSNAPAIKTLKLTGTTASTQGGSVSVAHGLTVAKILSVDVLVEYGTNLFVHHSYTANNGYDFSFWINSSINIINVSGNSANILSKPFKIFITYEE